MQYTTKQLQERYKSLPEDLKDTIWSAESANAIQSISKKYNLNIEQMGKLSSETGLVLLGFTHPKDYIKNLSASISIDMDTARKIAEEVNNIIFSKIKENLKKLHGIGVESTPPAPSAKTQEKLKETPLKPPPLPRTPLELLQKHEPEKYSSAAPLPSKLPSMPTTSTSIPPKPPISPYTAPFETTSKKLEAASSAPPRPDIPLKPTEASLIFPEKLKEEPHREQNQTIEIKKPDIFNSPKIYNKGEDPYREPI